MRNAFEYAVARTRPTAGTWWFGPLGGVLGAMLMWAAGVPATFSNFIPQTIVRSAFEVLVCVVVAYLVMFCFWLAAYPVHKRFEQQGGLAAALRQRLGVQMWPMVLMAAGILFFVGLSGSGLIWFVVQAASGVDALRVLPPGVQPTTELPTAVVVPTAPDDVPKKLRAIDSFEAILRDELAPLLHKGMQLSTAGWSNEIVAGKMKELRDETIGWRNAQADLAKRLRDVRDQSDKFPDIQTLYDPSYENALNPMMERFVGAIANLGDEKWNLETLRYFMQPIANDCYKELNNAETWRQNRLRNAIELRKRFSQ